MLQPAACPIVRPPAPGASDVCPPRHSTTWVTASANASGASCGTLWPASGPCRCTRGPVKWEVDAVPSVTGKLMAEAWTCWPPARHRPAGHPRSLHHHRGSGANGGRDGSAAWAARSSRSPGTACPRTGRLQSGSNDQAVGRLTCSFLVDSSADPLRIPSGWPARVGSGGRTRLERAMLVA